MITFDKWWSEQSYWFTAADPSALATVARDAWDAALKEAIKQQGEPVGWFKYDKVSKCYHPQYDKYVDEYSIKEGWVQLYTAAPACACLTAKNAKCTRNNFSSNSDGSSRPHRFVIMGAIRG